MKVNKTVKIAAKPAKKAVPAKVKELTETRCDFCQANLPDHGSYGWYPSCQGCGRDCCRKHNEAYKESWSDYPEWYCPICVRLFRSKYDKLFDQLATQFEKDEEKIQKQMRKESLESPIS